LDICDYRNYEKPQSFIDICHDTSIILGKTREEIADIISIVTNHIIHKSDNILFVLSFSGLCLDDIKKMEKRMIEDSITHVIYIVVLDGKQRLVSISLDDEKLREKHIEVFSFYDLLHNPVKHVMSGMKYSILDKKQSSDVKKICAHNRLHKILISDPSIRLHGAHIGDIIQIDVYSQSTGKAIIYKQVIAE